MTTSRKLVVAAALALAAAVGVSSLTPAYAVAKGPTKAPARAEPVGVKVGTTRPAEPAGVKVRTIRPAEPVSRPRRRAR
jgi:hypothetical protein